MFSAVLDFKVYKLNQSEKSRIKIILQSYDIEVVKLRKNVVRNHDLDYLDIGTTKLKPY